MDLIENRYIVKCKGFSLKMPEVKNYLSFETICGLMRADCENLEIKQSVAIPQEKWDRSGNDTIHTEQTSKKFSVPLAGNAKRVRIDPSDEHCIQYPWGHEKIDPDSQAFKRAKYGLILDGRIKPKNEIERLEFAKIRKG